MHYDFYSTPRISGFLGGIIDGELIVDKNQRAIPYSKIGTDHKEKNANI